MSVARSRRVSVLPAKQDLSTEVPRIGKYLTFTFNELPYLEGEDKGTADRQRSWHCSLHNRVISKDNLTAEYAELEVLTLLCKYCSLFTLLMAGFRFDRDVAYGR